MRLASERSAFSCQCCLHYHQPFLYLSLMEIINQPTPLITFSFLLNEKKKQNVKNLDILTIAKDLSKFFRKRERLIFHLVYYSTLDRYVKNNKSKKEKSQKSGVYKLSCGSCDKICISQTGRAFARRIDEHEGKIIQERQILPTTPQITSIVLI